MKPQLLQVSKTPEHSFNTRRDTEPDINNRWHYHPEVELVYVKQGNGALYIGDYIGRFEPGQLVLIGSNLPHFWQFDESYFNDNDQVIDVLVIHFKENFWGDHFLDLPENKSIKNTLFKAKRGIQFTSPKSSQICEMIEQVLTFESFKKMLKLLEILFEMGNADGEFFASIGFQNSFQESEKDRIDAIYNYSIKNFNRKITLNEIAAIANVSPNSFCRFFKSRSRKTYSTFVNELRIGHACKLLIDNKLTVKEICFISGFNNFASFHKYFKKTTGKTPLSYQKSFINGNSRTVTRKL
jgi:AraC-like DNA-binding protein